MQFLLPKEIWNHIINYIDNYGDMVSLGNTCQLFREICTRIKEKKVRYTITKNTLTVRSNVCSKVIKILRSCDARDGGRTAIEFTILIGQEMIYIYIFNDDKTINFWRCITGGSLQKVIYNTMDEMFNDDRFRQSISDDKICVNIFIKYFVMYVDTYFSKIDKYVYNAMLPELPKDVWREIAYFIDNNDEFNTINKIANVNDNKCRYMYINGVLEFYVNNILIAWVRIIRVYFDKDNDICISLEIKDDDIFYDCFYPKIYLNIDNIAKCVKRLKESGLNIFKNNDACKYAVKLIMKYVKILTEPL